MDCSAKGNKTCEAIPDGAVTEFVALQRAHSQLLAVLRGHTGQPAREAPTKTELLQLDSVYFQYQRKLTVVKKEALDAAAASQEMRQPGSS